MELIRRKQALIEMRKRDAKGQYVPFQLVVCKLNFATKQGGDRLTVAKAIMYDQKHVKKNNVPGKSKMPNHEENGTRNIMLLPSGEIRTIHVRLIEKFNNKIVYD